MSAPSSPQDTPPPRRIPYGLKSTLMLGLVFLSTLALLRSPILHADFPDLNAQPQQKRPPFVDLQLFDKNMQTTALSSFRGKVVLLSFWASWCPPCLEELPAFAQLQKLYAEDLVVVPVNQDDDPASADVIRSLWAEHQLPFKTYFDPEHKLARAVDLEVLPTNFVLDRQGRLVFSSHGRNHWSGPEAQKFLATLIQEPH